MNNSVKKYSIFILELIRYTIIYIIFLAGIFADEILRYFRNVF